MKHCRKCHRFVHYGYSQLSGYQIQLCLAFKTQSCQCQNCTKVSQNILNALERNKITEHETINSEKTTKNHIIEVGGEIKEKIEQRIDGL